MLLETHNFEFGEFVFDPREKVLFRDGAPVPIAPKVLQLLLVLIENQGHIVEKEKLIDLVWADSFVEESNLTYSIRQLRKLLGDDKQHPRYIETIPRRGYRFIAGQADSQTNGFHKNVSGETITADASLKGRFSRPVFFSILSVLLCMALFSAGFFFWSGGKARSSKFSFRGNPDLKFETVASSDTPMVAAISPDG